MAYNISYKASVEKDVKKLSHSAKVKILDKIENDLPANPKEKGQPLKGRWESLWKYELRPYRVIYTFSESEKIILIVRIGHRKDAYR